jgi:hypothetical protein
MFSSILISIALKALDSFLKESSLKNYYLFNFSFFFNNNKQINIFLVVFLFELIFILKVFLNFTVDLFKIDISIEKYFGKKSYFTEKFSFYFILFFCFFKANKFKFEDRMS